MEDAIGSKISDYSSSRHPSQVLALQKISREPVDPGAAVSKDYIQEFNQIATAVDHEPGL